MARKSRKTHKMTTLPPEIEKELKEVAENLHHTARLHNGRLEKDYIVGQITALLIKFEAIIKSKNQQNG